VPHPETKAIVTTAAATRGVRIVSIEASQATPVRYRIGVLRMARQRG